MSEKLNRESEEASVWWGTAIDPVTDKWGQVAVESPPTHSHPYGQGQQGCKQRWKAQRDIKTTPGRTESSPRLGNTPTRAGNARTTAILA